MFYVKCVELTWNRSPERPGSPEQSMLVLMVLRRAAPGIGSGLSSSSTDRTPSDPAAAAPGDPQTDQHPTATPGLNKQTDKQRRRHTYLWQALV